ncbi:hypothetical protein J7L02_01085, partial [Candidatus Woesearchaeota archaeon]|nr:hypothetical protein [Candidatus Woesearchaeota archaeon]
EINRKIRPEYFNIVDFFYLFDKITSILSCNPILNEGIILRKRALYVFSSNTEKPELLENRNWRAIEYGKFALFPLGSKIKNAKLIQILRNVYRAMDFSSEESTIIDGELYLWKEQSEVIEIPYMHYFLYLTAEFTNLLEKIIPEQELRDYFTQYFNREGIFPLEFMSKFYFRG